MPTYFVTGATGFLGRRLVERLLARPDCDTVHVLVRPQSMPRFAEVSAHWSDRVIPVAGDLAEPGLGVDAGTLFGAIDHVVHLGAVYDLTASAEANRVANVVGTGHAIDFAAAVNAGVLHHVSSIAVAGDHRGRFTEADFDLGQRQPTPYHATKFEAERLVRAQRRVPYRIYRPSAVVGDSRTGEMDKVDGPYYFLPLIARLSRLPAGLPLVSPDLGGTNIVPVDYVVAALAHLIHLPAPSGRTYHLTNNGNQRLVDVYNAFAEPLGAPRISATLPVKLPLKPLAKLPSTLLAELGIPAEVVPVADLPTDFDSTATVAALAGSAIALLPLEDYAKALVRYWKEHLDPERVWLAGESLRGKRIVVTGASSGIGKATAITAARKGATVLLVARRADELGKVAAKIESYGGAAEVHPCDLTDADAVQALVKDLGVVDVLVNNAGRSIRRSVRLSVDRMHDYERTMSLNYFAPLRLTLGLLPGMRARGSGRIVNVTTMGLQSDSPRFSAYLASKGALEAFGRSAGRELLSDGVTIVSVRMPLVRTPMIGATDAYRGVPAMSSRAAADMVLRALRGRGEVVQHPAGVALELLRVLAPGLTRNLANMAYRMASESAPESATKVPGERPAKVLTSAVVGPIWRALRPRADAR